MSTATATRIDLARGHEAQACREMAVNLQRQLSHGYTRNASVLPLGDHDDYLATHRTARKRAQHARNLGYAFQEINRAEHEDDIHEINISLPFRQGRPMADAYLQRPTFGVIPKLCDEHHVYTYGVTKDDQLWAYLWLYRCGDLAMISSILGHAARLKDDIMQLLVTETLRDQSWFGGTAFYNLHSSGTAGLRYFKERLGFRPSEVAWSL